MLFMASIASCFRRRHFMYNIQRAQGIVSLTHSNNSHYLLQKNSNSSSNNNTNIFFVRGGVVGHSWKKNPLSVIIRRWLSLGGRGFINTRVLKLHRFEQLVAQAEKRHRGNEKEKKRHLEASLDEPSREVMLGDALTYIYLSNTEDTHNYVRLLQRLREQRDQEQELGLDKIVTGGVPLNTMALRKCYLLNSTDVAVDILADVKDDVGYGTSLQLVMDLLYRNRQWEKCVDIAVEALESGRLTTSMSWLFDMSILAAFKLNSSEGLSQAAKIFDACKDHDPRTVKFLQMILAKYCVEENHVQAAMTLINQIGHDNDLRIFNIKVLCLLQSGNIQKAVGQLKWYTNVVFKENLPDRLKRKGNVDSGEEAAGEDEAAGEEESAGGDEAAGGDEQVEEVSTDDQSDSVPQEAQQPEESEGEKKKIGKKFLLYRDVFHKMQAAIKASHDPKLKPYGKFLSHNYNDLVSTNNLSYHLMSSLTHYYWQSTLAKRRRQKQSLKDNETETTSAEKVEADGTAV